MKLKKFISLCLIAVMMFSFVPANAFAIENTEDVTDEVFYDDFSGDSLDTSKWLIAEKAWGGGNGGVVPQNVSVSDGKLKLEGHGDNYTGDVPGINRENGTRTGAAIATRDYFGSGSYEVVAKVAPELGACSAIWTFEYEEYYPGDEKYEELGATGSYYVVNHEIDIEMPGRASNGADPSYEYALCNTWTGEKGGEYTTGYTKLATAQNDGEFHTYRFDWHTGDDKETKRVDFYFDGELVTTNYEHVPTNAGRLWIGLWFPNGWAGKKADFDTTVFEIDSVKITPFHEAGDTEQNETYGKDGWAANSFPEDIEKDPIEEDKPLTYSVTLTSDKETVKKGDTFTVTASISELEKNSFDGLLAISGKLVYDPNVVEMDLDSIKGLKTWSMDKEDFNPNNFKFVTDSSKYVSETGDIFTVNFKVKEDIDVEDILINLTSVEGGTASFKNGLVLADDTELHIKLEEEIIEEPEYITSETYNIGELYITKIEAGTTVNTFISNVDTNANLVFVDAEGNELGADDLIKTGVKLKVGTTFEFELVVNGDTDGDGLVTANDLAQVKLHIIELRELTGSSLEAAKVDGNDIIEANDLAMIKLIIIS